MFVGHSRPDEWRTARSILETFCRREESAREAEQKGHAPDKTALVWNGVSARPCRILQELFLDKPVADFLVPLQLHLLLVWSRC